MTRLPLSQRHNKEKKNLDKNIKKPHQVLVKAFLRRKVY